MRRVWVLCGLIIFAAGVASADEPTHLDKIVVTPSRFRTTLGESGRAVTVLDGEDRQIASQTAIPDVINEIGGIDIRRRGPEGVQADVAIRGTTFEQNSVLINGIAVNDPQTGHFSMDLPLTTFDLDRVEILKGPASSVYGPNSFGGTLNLLTTRPGRPELVVSASGGSFDYVTGGVSATNPFGPINNRFSFEESHSSGYMPETPFDIIALTDQATVDTFLGTYDFLFGYQKKDFGAANFYSNLYPNEEEHTDTRFFSISGEAESGPCRLMPKLFLRRHWDKFQLDQNRPGWQTNYSTNYTYGGQLDCILENALFDVAYGYMLSQDTIDSTNLQTHARTQNGAYVELSPHLGDKVDVKAGFREDYYTGFGWQYAPSMSASVEVAKHVRARSSVGRSYRIPTFTDLYYNDAANRGNDALRTESSWTYEAGMDCNVGWTSVSATYFYRDINDTIDWIRYNTKSKWQASNIGTAQTNGFELTFDLSPRKAAPSFPVDRAFITYTALATYDKHDYISKYALDYLKQQVCGGIDGEILGFRNSWVLNYKKRVGDSGYIVIDTKVTKNIFRKSSVTFEAFLEITNLFNIDYSEQSDIRMPGRWIKSGARITF